MSTISSGSTLKQLRIMGVLEGFSWLALLFTMFLKYVMSMPEPNKVVGMIHGMLFILYVIFVFMAKFKYNWSWKKTGWALVASIVPGGTFYADAKLFRN